MKYSVLMLLLVKSFMVNGFGEIDIGPFQMKFDVPETRSFPSSPTSFQFPAIFNPTSALMQRDSSGSDYFDNGMTSGGFNGMTSGGYNYGNAMGPKAVGSKGYSTSSSMMPGMDMEMPAMPEMPEMSAMPTMSDGKIKTSRKTENKDGFKVTTINRDGPGFHSYIQEYVSDGGNNTNNGTGMKNIDMSALMSPLNIFNIIKQVGNKGKDSCNKTCRMKGKFCDQVFGHCRKKFPEGRTCMLQKQCQKPLKCVWGRCERANAGDAGTFCKKQEQCVGATCCRNTLGSFHKMCIPQANEGAICGFRDNAFSTLFYVTKRNTVNTCNPCLFGLKCGEVGDAKYKRCVKVSYIEKEENKISNTTLPQATTSSNPGEKTASYSGESSGDDDTDDDDDNRDDGKGRKPPPPINAGPNKGKEPHPPPENEDDAGKEEEKSKAKPNSKHGNKSQEKTKNTGGKNSS